MLNSLLRKLRVNQLSKSAAEQKNIIRNRTRSMIHSQLEIIEQAKRFLGCLTDEQYTHVVKPHFSSSAGAHMRHIIDHYQALMHREGNTVNYNIRHRFSDVENSTAEALAQLDTISV